MPNLLIIMREVWKIQIPKKDLETFIQNFSLNRDSLEKTSTNTWMECLVWYQNTSVYIYIYKLTKKSAIVFQLITWSFDVKTLLGYDNDFYSIFILSCSVSLKALMARLNELLSCFCINYESKKNVMLVNNVDQWRSYEIPL